MQKPSTPLAFIVEDDGKLITIYTQALKAAGFNVMSSMNGLEAIETLAGIEPSLVLLDLHLPGANGDKVLESIRATDRLNGTTVIVATADPLQADALNGKSDFVFLKPISFVQLRDLATRFIKVEEGS